MCYLVPGPTPCPEVVAVSYIRPAEVPTLPCVEGEAQVERQNTIVGFLTSWNPSLLQTHTDLPPYSAQIVSWVICAPHVHRPHLGTLPCICEHQVETKFAIHSHGLGLLRLCGPELVSTVLPHDVLYHIHGLGERSKSWALQLEEQVVSNVILLSGVRPW